MDDRTRVMDPEPKTKDEGDPPNLAQEREKQYGLPPEPPHPDPLKAKLARARQGRSRQIKSIRQATRGLPKAYLWDTKTKGPLPKKYVVAGPYPCRRCKAVLTEHASQAVVCYGVHGEEAYLRCRVCGNEFTMEVERT